MILQLPLDPTLTHYEFDTVLDGIKYTLEFRFNVIDLAWYFSLYLEDDTPIFQHATVVLDFPISTRIRHLAKPKGTFIAIDTTGQGVAPNIDDFGSRVQLYYLDAATTQESLQ